MVNLLKNEATSTSLISISLIKMSCVTLMLTENCLHWVVISYNFPNPKQSVQTLVKEHIYIAISRIFGVSDRSYVLPKEFKITHNVTFALEIESTISISTTLIFQIDNGNKHIADTLKSNYIELKKYYYFTLKNTRLVQPSESQRQSFRRLLDS